MERGFPQDKAGIVAPLNFVIRGLTTSCDENNCPHNALETIGGGVTKNTTLSHLRTIHFACPSLGSHHLSVNRDTTPSLGPLS